MRRIGLLVPAVCLVITMLVGSGPARAGSGRAARAITARRSTQPNVPVADFDADGLGDLAVGAVYEAVNGKPAGGVFVFYGGSGGIALSRTALITEADLGLTPSAYDEFGLAMAAGNFNGDAYDDLAVGALNRAVNGKQMSGEAFVLYGSAGGLKTTGVTTLKQGGAGATDPEDAPEAEEEFGTSLAVGNFGQGPEDDLAVGTGAEAIGSHLQEGAVSVFFGSPSGVKTAGHQFFTQRTSGVPGAPQDSSFFGFALAAGDFGRSARSDLAIGALHYEVGGQSSAGAVVVLYGSSDGLTTSGARLLEEGAGLPGSPTGQDLVGYALAAGDFGKSGQSDLAIGVPGKTVNGHADAGEAIVVYGSSSGLDTGNEQVWTQANDGASSQAEASDYSGLSLAAANFGHSSRADLVIGAPIEAAGSVERVGAVVVVYGTSSGLSASNSQLWYQGTSGIQGVDEMNDDFGLAVAGAGLGDLRYAALVAGVPYEDVGSISDAGAINVILGGSGGLTSAGNFLVHEDTTGVPTAARASESLGTSVVA